MPLLETVIGWLLRSFRTAPVCGGRKKKLSSVHATEGPQAPGSLAQYPRWKMLCSARNPQRDELVLKFVLGPAKDSGLLWYASQRSTSACWIATRALQCHIATSKTTGYLPRAI